MRIRARLRKLKRRRPRRKPGKSQKTYIKELKGDLKKDALELAGLYKISQSLTSSLDLKEILDMVTEQVAKLIKADVCTLRLIEGEKENRLVLRSAYGLEHKNMELKKDIRMDEPYVVVKVVKDATAVSVDDLMTDTKYEHKPFDQHRKLRSMISVPLIEKNKVIGTLSVYNRKRGVYKNEDKEILLLFATLAAIAIENARLFENTRSNYINMMRFFASVIDAKDSYTAGHSDRVMRNMMRLAERLGMSNREKEVLRYASFLHDIGKISIDPAVLSKTDPLSEKEWLQIKEHPLIGANIVKKIGFLDDVIPVILHHHEKYAGGGYPHSDMKDGQIPLMARVLAVVDTYEAMTSDRPYRKALTDDEALEELKKAAGTQFDPKVVKLFANILKGSRPASRYQKAPAVK